MSIWNLETNNYQKQTLSKDIKVDILIIGAGMTGLTTAYYLQNKNICVVDANVIGRGVTLNSTAKINYFQERVYTKIKKITNEQTALNYLHSQRYALKHLQDIIKKEHINCDFTRVPSYVFANTKDEVTPLEQEVNFLKSHGIEVTEKLLPKKITSYKSYCVNDTYIFNPIKYLYGLSKILKDHNINIYENTKILKVEKQVNHYICYGEKYHITANKVVFACHYPYFLKPFFLPLKSTIEKSYIIVSKVKQDGKFTCISSSTPTYSCRFYQTGDNIYQISLAESHNTSIKQNDCEHFKRVQEIFQLKEKDIILKYSNVDIITPDYLPYIGSINKNMYLACGYNTWGMTNSILAAKIISDMLLNKNNPYQASFNPNRLNLALFIKLPLIIASQIKSFFGPKISKNKSWYSPNITFFKKNNQQLACFQDEHGKKHIVHNKCPHLGCSLIFNEVEKTWDCPCHSSRFDIDGKCLKGPSNYDISYNQNKTS